MTSKLEKLISSIHKMLDLEEKKKELYGKLIEACTVKDYKEKNPDAKSVVLISYFAKDAETKEVDKYRTYECIDSTDHKRLDKLDRIFGPVKYRGLERKKYDLTKFCPDKTVATVTEEITG